MPELPEVETVRLGLEPVLTGKRILKAEVFTPKLRLPIPQNLSKVLSGQRVAGLKRRAKYILMHLEGGMVALWHLGMSGQVLIFNEPKVPGKHDHLKFEIEGGITIMFRDPRRFGLFIFCSEDELNDHPLLKSLGPEPLSNTFNGPALKAALNRKTVSIKAALLDQRVVAGVGNIYASEALYRAGISPKRKAGSLSNERCERLALEVRNVLKDALKSGGSSLRDFVRVNGELGYFQHRFEVYDQEGQACRTKACSGTIRRVVQNQRSTFYCPRCQR